MRAPLVGDKVPSVPIRLFSGIQDGGRIFRLIATAALAHPLSARGSRSTAAKAVDAADGARLRHGLLQALHGSLAASPRIEAAMTSTGGRRRKNRARRSLQSRALPFFDRARPRRFLGVVVGVWDVLMAPKPIRTPRSLRARQSQDPGGTRKDKKLLVPGLKEHSNLNAKGPQQKISDMEKDARNSVPTMFASMMRIKQMPPEKAARDSQSHVPGADGGQVSVTAISLEVLTPICDAGGMEPASLETTIASPGNSGEVVGPPHWGVINHLNRS
ncbi:hypothetical protein NDU88_002807 [Pleurodeles waltl]|uniref:Uncharacterized protein n=1 Tax=Pleurodeles waltl TaxID=8319 RepID=A0AAV7TLP5_PLEWA|nr:hypothetical protein NDU88_002807 [Pleurodeles waltl]